MSRAGLHKVTKTVNKSGKRKVVKVGRDGRKRAYWVGTSQKPGGRLRNEGAPGEHKTFLQKHGKKIAAGVAGAAAIGLGLAARHHLKSEAGQKHLHDATHAVKHILADMGPRPSKTAASPSAVLITGNPKYIKDNPAADKFYEAIEQDLKAKGYTVRRDPGEPYTSPPNANLWIGHSRGADRLRFAPSGTRTLAFGSNAKGAINHPDDVVEMSAGHVPPAAHYVFTPEMADAIHSVKAGPKHKPQRDNILYRAAKGALGSLRGHKKVTAAGIGHEISSGADAVRGQQHSHPSHHSTPTHSPDPVYRETHDTHSFEGNGRRFGGSQWGAR